MQQKFRHAAGARSRRLVGLAAPESLSDTATEQLLASLPEADLATFRRAEAAWDRLCLEGPPPPPPAVAHRRPGTLPPATARGAERVDVAVLGGTLGVVLAAALLARRPGLRVAVVERGALVGREQEYNVSYDDLGVLVSSGVLSAADLAGAVATRCSSVRVGVEGAVELRLRGVMDTGVSPAALLRAVVARFRELGGVVLERHAFEALEVFDDLALLRLSRPSERQPAPRAAAAAGGAGGSAAAFEPAGAVAAAGGVPLLLSARVVVDALGSFSPLSAQARRGGAPEAAMLLVGSCADAPPGVDVDSADVLWGLGPIDRGPPPCQCWWERFPAEGGAAVTSYMFAFTDPAAPNAGLLAAMLRQYLDAMPGYLGVPGGAPPPPLRRLVVGFVPCYAERVPPLVDRLLPVGDSAANRSALSLAGFCALLRHLPRLTGGLLEALDAGATSRGELALLQPWCPGVEASGAMQRSMALHSAQHPLLPSASGREVLDALGASLAAMWAAAGEAGMRPFVADRLQWGPLAAAVALQARTGLPQLVSYSAFLRDPRSAARLARGLAGLWAFSLLHAALPATAPLHEAMLAWAPRLLYRWRRAADAWTYGSGADWQARPPAAAVAPLVPAPPSGEDSLLGSYEGADGADRPLCPADQPLCDDPMHDAAEWGGGSSGGPGGGGLASPAAATRGAQRRRRRLAGVPEPWRSSARPDAAWLARPPALQRRRGALPAVAAAACGCPGGEGEGEGQDGAGSSPEQQRQQLERLLLSIVAGPTRGRRPGAEAERDLARRLLYPHATQSSGDDVELIDWGDTPTAPGGEGQAGSSADGGGGGGGRPTS